MTPMGRKQIVRRSHTKYVVWTRGKGPLVVLLHGWPESSYHWRFLIPVLDAKGFESLAIDLKGLGESVTNDRNFEKEVLAREILALVSKLHPQIKHFAIVGHDWGASIATAMAALAPDRISHLVVEDEVPPGISVPFRGESIKYYSTWHSGFHRVPRLPEALIGRREKEYVNYFLDLRFNRKSLSNKDKQIYLDCYRGKNKIRNSLGYYRSFQEDGQFFGALRTKKIQVPALALFGVRGMGSAVSDALRQICKDVTSIEMKRSGHYPAEEESTRFHRAVIRHLRR